MAIDVGPSTIAAVSETDAFLETFCARVPDRQKAMRRIQRSGNKELTGMPVGQIVSRMNQIRPAKDVIYEMVEKYIETMSRLSAGLQTT